MPRLTHSASSALWLKALATACGPGRIFSVPKSTVPTTAIPMAVPVR
jgi:hypothetical protein